MMNQEKKKLIENMKDLSKKIYTLPTDDTYKSGGIKIHKKNDYIVAEAFNKDKLFNSSVEVDRSVPTMVWVSSIMKWVLFVNFPDMSNYDINDIVNRIADDDMFRA